MTDQGNRTAELGAIPEGDRPRASRPPRRRQLSLSDRVEQAITSLFFILLGIAFLYVAYTTMYAAHATFTFVLVVSRRRDFTIWHRHSRSRQLQF